MHQHPALNLVILCSLVLSACSQSDDGAEPRADAARPDYRLTGTIATGRPGAWAGVCIETDCSRANDEGVYRLLAPRDGSALMRATLDNVDPSAAELTSLYRHDSEQTVALVNINPTTDALLDGWSRYRLDQPLATCAASSRCSSDLTASFTPGRQQAAQQQLQAWLAPRWQTARNPFTDPYLADPDLDWLDDLHDHLQLEATASDLTARDNAGAILGRLDYATLFDKNVPLMPMDEADLGAAFALQPRVPENSSPITIDYQASPSSPFTAPADWRVDVSETRSLFQGELSFRHTLVDPRGRVSTGRGALFSATLSDPGPYTWTVEATDSEGNRATDGLALQALASDVISQPSFGAEGSCSTSPLTANASNVCISTVDGGSLGACVADDGGSTQTRYSPAPCSPVAQQGGVFLGSCTSVLNQVRVHHYDNPQRKSGETLAEQRIRLRGQCVNDLGRDWSAAPPE